MSNETKTLEERIKKLDETVREAREDTEKLKESLSDAKKLLEKLSGAGTDVAADVGDPSMLPREVERSTRSSIARDFGDSFADEVLRIEPGHWVGPVRSGYGLHLVWVNARQAERMPGLDEVRPLVERELLSARRRQQIEAKYAEMLSRYRVVVEQRRTDPRGGR